MKRINAWFHCMNLPPSPLIFYCSHDHAPPYFSNCGVDTLWPLAIPVDCQTSHTCFRSTFDKNRVLSSSNIKVVQRGQ